MNLWQAIVVQVGLAPYMVVFNLLQDAVWDPVRVQHEPWMLAHEILLIYLDRVDQDADRNLNLGNVFGGGKVGVDATRSAAIPAAEARFGKSFTDIFRPSGGARAAEGSTTQRLIIHNDKFSAKSARPCMAWNLGNTHKQDAMHADGTCKFRHACAQWIKNADGSVGYCFRAHKRDACDRTPDERSNVGPSKP